MQISPERAAVTFHVLPDVKHNIRRAAAKENKTVAGYIRDRITRAVEKDLAINEASRHG